MSNPFIPTTDGAPEDDSIKDELKRRVEEIDMDEAIEIANAFTDIVRERVTKHDTRPFTVIMALNLAIDAVFRATRS